MTIEPGPLPFLKTSELVQLVRSTSGTALSRHLQERGGGAQ